MFTQFKLSLFVFVGIFLALLNTSARTEDSIPEEYKILQGLPRGVSQIEYDENGLVVKLKVKGEGDVPVSMRASRADRFAKEKAYNDARSLFIEYYKGNQNIFTHDSDDSRAQSQNRDESSTVNDGLIGTYESRAEATLRGLVTLAEEITGEGETRVASVVLGWSRRSSDSAASIANEMEYGAANQNNKTIIRFGSMDF